MFGWSIPVKPLLCNTTIKDACLITLGLKYGADVMGVRGVTDGQCQRGEGTCDSLERCSMYRVVKGLHEKEGYDVITYTS